MTKSTCEPHQIVLSAQFGAVHTPLWRGFCFVLFIHIQLYYQDQCLIIRIGLTYISFSGDIFLPGVKLFWGNLRG